MNRRTLLRGAAAALGGGAATAAGLRVAASPADGQTGLALDVAGDSATIATDGTVTAVSLDLTVEWAYDLPDATSPETVIIEVAAGPADGQVTTVASAESAQLFAAADGSESFDVGLLAEGALEASALTPDGAGTRETTVTVEARLRVESSNDLVLAKETTTDTAVLTVTRDGVEASAYGSVGGSGSLAIATK